MGWDEFVAWLAKHGIDAKRCDRVEMVLGSAASSDRKVLVWLKAHQFAVDEKGNPVFDATKRDVLWEEIAVPLVEFPEDSDKPIRWEEW